MKVRFIYLPVAVTSCRLKKGWQQLKVLDFNWEYSLSQLVLNAQVQRCVVRSRQRDVKKEIEQTNMNRTGSGPDSGSC